MNVLVTGSEGSLGQMIIPTLQKAGYLVVGVDNLQRHGPIRRDRAYRFIAGDLTDPLVVRNILVAGDFQIAFHLAALVYGVVGFHEKPADIFADNILATLNLLKLGTGKIGKFVYLSSSMVYERCAELPHREIDVDQSVVMSTAYGFSKYVGERAVKSFHDQHGLTYLIWRPFNIITPFEAPEKTGYSHVFADLVRKIVDERQMPLHIIGDGEQVRCFTSIFDVAYAIAQFSFSTKSDNETFNVANPEPVSIKELAIAIVRIGKEMRLLPEDYFLSLRSQPAYEDDVRRRIPDISKLRETFGWEPRSKIEELLRTYMEFRYGRPNTTRCSRL